MSGFVRVAVNVPSLAGVRFGARPDSFDYGVPTALSGLVDAGNLVLVPFGARTVQAVVLQVLDQPAVPNTKEVIELVDPQPVMSSAQIALAQWMAESTLASIGSMLGLFLPPGLSQRADTVFGLRATQAQGSRPYQEAPGAAEADRLSRSKVELRLIHLLEQRGPLRGRQIDRALPRIDWRRTARYLVRRGLLHAHSVLPPASVRPKFIRTAQLAVPPEAAERSIASLGSTATTQRRRQAAMEFLIRRPQAVNVSWVYAESGCTFADLQELAEQELIVLREEEVWRDPLASLAPTRTTSLPRDPVKLTAEQEIAWQAIEDGLGATAPGDSAPSFLLQGVTGSGKTELYIQAARKVVQQGRQAIVLVPEIALTPQTIDRFIAHFPGQVGVVHSKLSDGERYDTWRRARAGLLQVIVGPRSALFAPLPRLGLLIIDECHDASYYQAEPPFFDAVTVAQEYARRCGTVCILGSATPSVVQRYEAELGKSRRLELSQRVAAAGQTEPPFAIRMPHVQVVDMRDELRAGNRGSFSRNLQQALGDVLGRGEQAILFLNRRGTASYVFCRDCGYVARCPRCETPLTYHTSNGKRLLCHRCGYERQMLKRCPECGGVNIGAYGLGTEKVEAEVQRIWPSARTLRWDWETTRQKESHEIILRHFVHGRADVLVGTQMLAKGLDLPRVTLVGIMLADVGLFLPDPFAAERTFQVLTQVAGRAGRSSLGGKVVLQTFVPSHYAIQAAARHDAHGFYVEELRQRRRLGYPPFSHLLRLEYRHYDAAKAEEEARSVAEMLKTRLATAGHQRPYMIGPAPCFFSKLDGKYRWQIILRGEEFRSLIEGQRFDDWQIEVDPASLL